MLHGLSIDNEEQRERLRKLAYVASTFITIGFAVALLVIAPRLFDEAVFSEYGWQGGRPLLVYNGLLLMVAIAAAWALRATLEGRIAVTWFAFLWLLSFVHLVEGLRNVPVLSLLSYTLYSMALHAFHLPLAVLVGLVVLVVMGTLFAQTVAFSLSQHCLLYTSPSPRDP